ncbi:MAG: thiamine-phosphate kinase [Thermoplasmataceae archaeon]
MKLDELGEREIIRRTFDILKIKQEKDDCVIIPRGNDFELLTMDSINERTHIPVNVKPSLLGSFFANVNLSDIAAMGGTPEYFMASFNIPGNTEIEYLAEFEKGMYSALNNYNVEYLGGDTKENLEMSFTGLCIGRAPKKNIAKRSNIKKGQILCVTNEIGSRGSAFLYYVNGIRKNENASKMMSITPKIEEGKIISENGGKFMMDLSDGLGSAMHQMKSDYGLGFRIILDQLPISKDLFHISELLGSDPYINSLELGGDYELLFTIDNTNSKIVQEELNSIGVNFSMIGDVWEGENIMFNGERWTPILTTGFEHFVGKN